MINSSKVFPFILAIHLWHVNSAFPWLDLELVNSVSVSQVRPQGFLCYVQLIHSPVFRWLKVLDCLHLPCMQHVKKPQFVCLIFKAYWDLIFISVPSYFRADLLISGSSLLTDCAACAAGVSFLSLLLVSFWSCIFLGSQAKWFSIPSFLSKNIAFLLPCELASQHAVLTFVFVCVFSFDGCWYSDSFSAKEDNLVVIHLLALSKHCSTWLLKKDLLLKNSL